MSKKNVVNGKRILITSWSLANWGGAALNSLELALYLKECGATPVLFSYDIDGPMAEHIIKNLEIEVLTDEISRKSLDVKSLSSSQISSNDYDYVIVSANIIPIPIIIELEQNKKRRPKFIFLHMSALPAYPLDAPLFDNFEKNIAHRILSISEDTTDNTIKRILGENIKVDYYRNPAPKEFSEIKKTPTSLRRIAIISSSEPSEEVIEAGRSLTTRGLRVDYIGRFAGNERNVNSKFYEEYDLIIGIGKNVQYSMVSGIPIYVYGKFGGSGYLEESNIDKNKANNYSGRGFYKKTSENIEKEIINGYRNALSYHTEKRTEWIGEYSIDRVVNSLFKELDSEKIKEIDFHKDYINWMISQQVLVCQSIDASKVSNLYAKELRSSEEKQRQIILLKEELKNINERLNETLFIKARRKAGALKRIVFGNTRP